MLGIEIVEGFNAIYAYQGDQSRCLGADITVEEAEALVLSDPAGFLEAYNLVEKVQCPVCNTWTTHDHVICISVGTPPRGAWVCKGECEASVRDQEVSQC